MVNVWRSGWWYQVQPHPVSNPVSRHACSRALAAAPACYHSNSRPPTTRHWLQLRKLAGNEWAVHIIHKKTIIGLVLNPAKSDAILFGTSQRLKTMSSLSSVKLDDPVIQLSDTVKILGATLDSSLTMGPHTKATSKSCFYHIRSFRQIRSSHYGHLCCFCFGLFATWLC